MKKIALFVGSFASEYPNQLASSVASHCKGKYNVDIYSNLGNFIDSYFHRRGEQNIIDISNLADYDGIIVAPDSLDTDNLYDKLVAKIEAEATCPVISCRRKDDRFYNVLIDNTTAMNGVIEHFISHHGYKRICFMTGRLELEDARQRLESYRNIMAKYKLPVSQRMVFEGDYWRLKGEEAVNWFLGGEEQPEAIICANDYMAISVINALTARGIKVPEDIAVSGFDNIQEDLFFEHRLASVDVPTEEFGKKAVDMLTRLFEGKHVDKDEYIEVRNVFEGSCGCPSVTQPETLLSLYQANQYLTDTIMHGIYMSADSESCLGIDDIMQNAFRHSSMFDYDKLFVCLNDRTKTDEEYVEDIEKECFSETMHLCCVFDKEQNACHFTETRFPRREVLPAVYRPDGSPMYILSIHYKNNSFGYIAMITSRPEMIQRYFVVWMQNVASEMEKMEMYAHDKDFLRFKRESTIDDLTGLYNRREMENILRRRRMTRGKAGSFFVMNMDLDGLKSINDTYGHPEGDKAICAVAECLKKLPTNLVRASRTGGDEFALCILSDDDDIAKMIKQQIVDMLDEINEKKEHPYKLVASIGYALYVQGGSLSKCVAEADKKMYEEKAQHHASELIK